MPTTIMITSVTPLSTISGAASSLPRAALR
jgi:hypothetical protein